MVNCEDDDLLDDNDAVDDDLDEESDSDEIVTDHSRLYGKRCLEAFWRTYIDYNNKESVPRRASVDYDDFDWLTYDYIELSKQIEAFKGYHIWRTFEVTDKFTFLDAQCDDPVWCYLFTAGKHPFMNEDKERELLQIVSNQSGAAYGEAFSALCMANLRRVLRIVMYYFDSNLPAMELIQEGNLAMAEAILSYAQDKQRISLAKYVKKAVGYAVRKHIAKTISFCSIPLRFETPCRKIKNRYPYMAWEECRFDEYRQLPEWNRDVEKMFFIAICPPMDFQQADDDDYLIDYLKTEFNARRMEEVALFRVVSSRLHQSLQGLSEREREVIKLRYGFKDGTQWSLDDVGYRYGIFRERVRQIEAKGLRKLRNIADDLEDVYPIFE